MEWYHAFMVVYLAIGAFGIIGSKKLSVFIVGLMLWIGAIAALNAGGFFS